MQRVCQLASAHGSGKSLKVKKDERKQGNTQMPRPIVRDDLDVSVKSSPRAADKPSSCIPRQSAFFLTENRADGRFLSKNVRMDMRMLHGTTKETEIASELFICI